MAVPANARAVGRILSLMLPAAAALMVSGTDAPARSIRETIQAALDGSPDVGVVKANSHAVDQELRQARAGYYPSLDARAAIGPEHTRFSGDRRRASLGDDNGSSDSLLRKEAQLTLSQMLFDGFATRSEVERQTARASSAAYRVGEAAEFIGLDAAEAHLEVLRYQEIVRLGDANLAELERHLAQVRDLERAGRADSADIEQTVARIAQARATIAASRGSLADARATYEQIVGEPPAALTADTPPVAALPLDASAAATDAAASNPSVLIAAADVDVAEAELRAARASYLPRLDAELSASAADDAGGIQGEDVGASALLVLRYNLFRGGADIAREREAFHRANQSRAELDRTRRHAAEEARLSYNALETARARAAALREEAEAQRRTRDAYAGQFELGLRDLLDVLDAENQLFNARVALTTAASTELFAVYRSLAVAGALLDAVEVAPPRETGSRHRPPDDASPPAARGAPN